MIEIFTIISGIIAFFSIIKDINKKYFIFWTLILLLVFFDGLRWEMGVDWPNYYKYFLIADEYSFSGFEPGYLIYSSFIRHFTNNYSVFLLITTAFFYIIIFHTVFKITNYSFLSIFFLTSIIPWYSGSLRQMIAAAFFVLALKAIFDKRIAKYLVFFFISLMFHTSVIVFFPIYWFYRLSSLALLSSFFLASLLSFFSNYFIEFLDWLTKFYGHVKSYSQFLLDGIQSNTSPILGFVRKLVTLAGIIFFTFLITRNKHIKKLQMDKIKFTLFLSSFSIIFYYIGTFKIANVSSRVDLFAGVISMSILIGLLDKTSRKRFNRLFLYFFVIFLVAIFYYRLEWLDLFHPYSSIFYNFNLNRNLY